MGAHDRAVSVRVVQQPHRHGDAGLLAARVLAARTAHAQWPRVPQPERHRQRAISQGDLPPDRGQRARRRQVRRLRRLTDAHEPRAHHRAGAAAEWRHPTPAPAVVRLGGVARGRRLARREAPARPGDHRLYSQADPAAGQRLGAQPHCRVRHRAARAGDCALLCARARQRLRQQRHRAAAGAHARRLPHHAARAAPLPAAHLLQGLSTLDARESRTNGESAATTGAIRALAAQEHACHRLDTERCRCLGCCRRRRCGCRLQWSVIDCHLQPGRQRSRRGFGVIELLVGRLVGHCVDALRWRGGG